MVFEGCISGYFGLGLVMMDFSGIVLIDQFGGFVVDIVFGVVLVVIVVDLVKLGVQGGIGIGCLLGFQLCLVVFVVDGVVSYVVVVFVQCVYLLIIDQGCIEIGYWMLMFLGIIQLYEQIVIDIQVQCIGQVQVICVVMIDLVI